MSLCTTHRFAILPSLKFVGDSNFNQGLPPRLFAHQALLDCATSSVMTHTSVRHSSPLRTAPKKIIEMLSSFFACLPCEGNVDCINYVLCTVPFCVQAHNVTLHNTSLRDICPREKQRCVWHSHVKAGVARINILLLAMLCIRYPRFGFAVRVPSSVVYMPTMSLCTTHRSA